MVASARRREPIKWSVKESLFTEMEEVPRPVLTRHKYDTEKEIEKILETIDKPGTAVRLKLKSGADFKKAHMALRHGVRKYGAQFRYQRYGTDELRVWAEKMKGVKR